MSMLLRIAERVLNRPLLVHPDKLPLILGVLQGRIPLDTEEIERLRAAAEQNIESLPVEARAVMRGPVPDASRFVGSRYFTDAETGRDGKLPHNRTNQGIAVLPVIGGLVNRGTALEQSSLSEQSYEGLKFQLAHALSDPKTKGAILDIESPGGEAVGAFEAAEAVRALASEKPVTAVVNGMAASAAYAIASGANKIVTTSTGVSGSIGVVMMHADFSRALDKAGVSPSLIFAGAHKVDGNPFEPLSKDVRNDLQGEVDQFYEMFVETVARGRSAMSPKSIRGTEARTFVGIDAVKNGLADDVGTFETALADLIRGTARNTVKTMKGMRMAEDSGKPAAVNADSLTPAAAPASAAPAATTVDAAATEQSRIRAILTCDEAKGRDALAQHIAFNTRMSADEAKAMLAVAPRSAPTSSAAPARAAESPIGIVVTDASPAGATKKATIDTASIYAKRATAMNKGVGA